MRTRYRAAAEVIWFMIFSLALSCPAHATTPPSFALEWGSPGSGPGEFHGPIGIAIGPSGAVYVTDSNNNRVQKFDRFGTFILEWGATGVGDGQFNDPNGIAVTGTVASDTVYVVDTWNFRVQKFTGDGSFILKWGSYGEVGPGEFARPIGVAVDESAHVYVTDWYAPRIQKFTDDGTYVTAWGSWGTGIGQFQEPSHMIFDDIGDIYITERGNDRIQKFTSSGTYIGMWGTSGVGDGQFDRPSGITMGPDNVIYVVDNGNNRVQAFTMGGSFLCKWGSFGTGPGEFNSPSGIVITDDGNEIFTVESLTNPRIQKFSFGATGIGDPVRPPRLVLQSWPNPFTEQTTIRYSLPEASPFQLAVYDVQGRLVRVLATGESTTGDQVAQWRGYDQTGARVSSGVYFLRLTTQGQSTVTKLHVVR